MQTTRTIVGREARKAVLDGVNAIAVPVGMTLGPEPRKALTFRQYNRGSRIIDDGHTLAQVQEPRSPFARLAAHTFREACQRTNEKVGDGTATTAAVGGRLFNDCYALVEEGSSTMAGNGSGRVGVSTLRRRILESAEAVKAAIRASAHKISSLEELERVATVSVGGNAALGKTIAGMAWKVGVDGFIDVVEGYKGEIETEVMTGFRFPAKPGAKAFVNRPERYEMTASDVPVLVTNHPMDNQNVVAPIMRKINEGDGTGDGTNKVVVIAPSFSDAVLIEMVAAAKKGYFIYPAKVPALRTEQFEDLAVYCGARFVDKSKGASLSGIAVSDLGFAEKIVVKDTEAREDATIIGGRGSIEVESRVNVEVPTKGGKTRPSTKAVVSSPVADRIAVLKSQLSEQSQESFRKLLERRIASMGSSVGIIRVGGSTQASSLDEKLKVEDAVYACKAALRGGYVAGGGLCLAKIADTLPEGDVLKAALSEPYRKIQASVDGGVAIGKDVIDPADAEFYAVEHACGVVANLITVEIVTAEVDEQSPAEGYAAIAREIGMIGLSMRVEKGQLDENQREMERDRLNGLTEDEVLTLDSISAS